MLISEVQIRLAEATGRSRLLAFAAIIFDDCFIVRDVKIIERDGKQFVSMPSRKRTKPCYDCSTKNHAQAFYCNHCGVDLSPDCESQTNDLFADIAHPLKQTFREYIHKEVMRAYEEEKRG